VTKNRRRAAIAKKSRPTVFGAALLMPASLVRKEIHRYELDLDDADGIDFLARRFQVSTAAMTNRLTTLGLLR
jgi:predicted transcriptional regulator